MLLKTGKSLDAWIKQETEDASRRMDGSYDQMMQIARFAIEANGKVAVLRKKVWDLKAFIEKRERYIPERYKPLTKMYQALFNILPDMDLEEIREEYRKLKDEYPIYQRIFTLLEAAQDEREAKQALKEAEEKASDESDQISYRVAHDLIK